MEKTTIDLPTMYGDHHVVEVRRLLLAIPGVEDVYASAAFRAVEVSFDQEKTGAEKITAELEKAGYLGEMPMPTELSTAVEPGETGRPFMRHTALYETTKSVVSFAQKVEPTGRALWPCPGIGVLSKMEE